MDFNSLVKSTEIELLKLIVVLLKTGAMRLEEVRIAAKEFLSFIPFQNQQALVYALKTFTEKYPQFVSLYTGLLKSIENNKVNSLIAKMQSFVK